MQAEREIVEDYEKQIDVFVTDLITLLQSAHKAFAAHETEVSDYLQLHGHLQQKPDRKKMLQLVRARMRNRWGDDEMLPLLARVMVNGDFAF